MSSSLLPAQESRLQNTTTAPRKTFFCHLTEGLCLPDLENRPFSMIRTAGNSCSGVDSRIATESASVSDGV